MSQKRDRELGNAVGKDRHLPDRSSKTKALKKKGFNSIMDSYYKGHENTPAGEAWKKQKKSGVAHKFFKEVKTKLSNQ